MVFLQFRQAEVQHLTRPSVVTITLAGFRSRWVMPRWCAAPTASASGMAIVSNRSSAMPPAGMHRRQRLPFDQLHREKWYPVDVFDGMDGDDVGVIEGGGGARLALEALAPFGIGRKVRRQDLHRDVPAKARVPSAIDVTHPAGADELRDAVRPDRCAWAEPPHARRRADGRFKKRPGVLVRRQQTLHLALQGGIAPTGFAQKRRARRGVARERRVKQTRSSLWPPVG